MRTMKRTAIIVLVLAVVFTFAACGGDAAENSKSPDTYTWNNVDFTVKSVKLTNSDGGKAVMVELDFGDKGMAQNVFVNNVNKGMLLFAGEKPEESYQYRIMGNGNLAGVNVFFNVADDYELDRNDLVITD